MSPTYGFTLSSAFLIPDFVEQALGLDLFDQAEGTRLTPLDDLKEWMRSDPWRAGDLFARAGELLLGDERAARAAAEKAGQAFDLADFELAQMAGDAGYECLDPAWAAALLRLALDEADAVQAFSRRAHATDFALAASFRLPDPRRHPRFSPGDIAGALARPDADAGAGKRAPGKAVRLDLEGAFQVDLSAPGGGPDCVSANGVGFVRVPITDPRAGDGTVAHLSLAYPLETEGYFLLTFEALRRELSLLGAGPHAS